MRLFTLWGAFVTILWLLWTAFIVVLLIVVGGYEYSKFFSRWMYLFVWIYYTLWFAQYSGVPLNLAEWFSYALVFFFHGLVWLWTIATLGLVLVGAPLVFEDTELLARDDIGFIVVGAALSHFTPILFILIYIAAHRVEIAYFHSQTHMYVDHENSCAASTRFLLNAVILPVVPLLLYLIFFNPFDVYEVDSSEGPYWMGAVVVFLVTVLLNLGLLFYIYLKKSAIRGPTMAYHRYPTN